MVKKVVLAVSGVFSLLACETPPSDVVHAFMGATRGGDLAVLATVSVVGWPGERVKPSEIGAWWVTRVAASEIEPFQLEERQERLNAARAARDARLQETGEGEDPELERIQSRVERLRVQVEGEREAARKSVETWTPIDGLQGEVETRRVEIIVRSPSGDQPYAVTLKRYRLFRSRDTHPIPSRWIVTGVESAGG